MNAAILSTVFFLVATVSSKPVELIESKDCSSAFCAVLNNVYTQIPDYVNKVESDVCNHEAIFQIICHEILDLFKGQVDQALQKLVKDAGQVDQCQVGPIFKNSPNLARQLVAVAKQHKDSCDGTPACIAFTAIYTDFPIDLAAIEHDICTHLVINTDLFRHLCYQVLTEVNTQFVKEFSTLLQTEAVVLGCQIPTTTPPPFGSK